jgi:uncharacterized pyridoxamine 5'-phosphate oxidase family protein
MNTEDKIAQELKSINQPLGVISTVNESGKPQSASVYYVYDNALNIYFITKDTSRKYENSMRNPHVSFVITSENPPKTIQLEGVVHKVEDVSQTGDLFNKLVSLATASNFMPPVSQIASGKVSFMKIATTWVRAGNFEVMKEGNKFIETDFKLSNDTVERGWNMFS